MTENAAEDESEENDRTALAPLALFLTGSMVLAAAVDLIPIVTAAFIAALLMILTGCISPAEAQRALNVQVLGVIAASVSFLTPIGYQTNLMVWGRAAIASATTRGWAGRSRSS